MNFPNPKWGFAGSKPQAVEVLSRLSRLGFFPELVSVAKESGTEDREALARVTAGRSRFLEGDLENHGDALSRLHFLLVCRYELLRPKVFEAPRWGSINIHSSLLPRYRGVHPVSWALINGESETGVTLHKIDQGIDTGKILKQRATPIYESDDIWSLTERLNRLSGDLISELFGEICAQGGLPEGTIQQGAGSYARRRTPSDGEIRFDLPTKSILNLFRALSPPLPRPFFRWKERKYEVLSCRTTSDLGDLPSGTLVGLSEPGKLNARCADGWIEMETAPPIEV